MHKSIALVGYRACGKSTLAGLLSKKLKYKKLSTDKLIEKEIGMTITRYTKSHTWSEFRAHEQKILFHTLETFIDSPIVLDCGGGIVLDPENVKMIRKHCHVFYINVSAAVLSQRIKTKLSTRPSLSGKMSSDQEVATILKERKPLYEKCAHVKINATDKEIDEIADEIISHLPSSGKKTKEK